MDVRHTPRDWYARTFERFERSLNGESRSDLHHHRRKAMERFEGLGFPTTAQEDWRFTNIAPITKVPFDAVLPGEEGAVPAEDLAPFLLKERESLRLVFVDGIFSEELSVNIPVQGAVVGSLRHILRRDDGLVQNSLTGADLQVQEAFPALNTAFLQDGAFVSVEDGVQLDLPIHIVYVSGLRAEPFFTSPRNVVLTGRGSRLSILETYVACGKNMYLTNAVTEIVVGKDSVVEHDKLQHESEHAYHIGTTSVRQHEGSRYVSNAISLGGSIVRNGVTATLGEERCESTLNGLSLATGRQLVDNHTAIDHASPNCVSHELYKAILSGKSRGVFNGKIFVRKDAQKTDAKQTNKTLLLSDDAVIDTKPQLEIFADDVKCTHGATVGQLDQEQIHYLRSRGIGLDESRDILTFAFAGDVVERVHVAPLRDHLEALVHSRLRHGRAGSGSDDARE